MGVKKFINPLESKCEEYKLTEKGFSFNLKIIGNPLLRNLSLPSDLKSGNLQYQSIIKGAIRGAMEILKYKVQVILIYEDLKTEKNESIFFVDATKL